MQYPPRKKLSQEQIQQVYTYLVRNIEISPKVIMRDLSIRGESPGSPILIVSPRSRPFYQTYFWWLSVDKNGKRRSHGVSEKEVHQYWMSILTSLNEAPDIILANHVKTGKHCLYHYRILESV